MRFELCDASAYKFWEIATAGKRVSIRFGRIGTAGQTHTKTAATPSAALALADELAAEKVSDGYVLATGRCRRRVLQKGTKRWEIAIVPTLGKSTITIRDGAKVTTETHEFTMDALPAFDRHVGKQLAKGYVEVDPAPGAAISAATGAAGAAIEAAAVARRAALEAAVETTHDPAAYDVLGDYLQSIGDPRGELVALARKPAAFQRHLAKHAEAVLGPLADHATTYDGKPAFEWRHGFIYRARIAHARYGDQSSDVLDLLLRHPSGRFLAELEVVFHPISNDGHDIARLLARAPRPSLRKLVLRALASDDKDISEYFSRCGYAASAADLSQLWPAIPNLRHLELEGISTWLGNVELPHVEHVSLRDWRSGITKQDAQLSRARWPALQHLHVSFGFQQKLGQLRPLLDRTDIAPTHLGLSTEMAFTPERRSFPTELVAALPTIKLLRGLRTLDLSNAGLTDELVAQLAAHAAAFAHLETIDLSRNFLGAAGVRSAASLGKRAIVKPQHPRGELITLVR